MHDQRPNVRIQGETPVRAGVQQASAQLQSDPRFRIATVVPQPQLQLRRQQRARGEFMPAGGFEPQPQPVRVRACRAQARRRLRVHAHPIHIRFNRQLVVAERQQFAAHSESSHLHFDIGFNALPASGGEPRLSLAVAEHAPDRQALVHVELQIGMRARERAVHADRRATIFFFSLAAAFRVRRRHPGQHRTGFVIRAQHGGRHVHAER